jgi:hypothetical protein
MDPPRPLNLKYAASHAVALVRSPTGRALLITMPSLTVGRLTRKADRERKS